MNSTSFAPSLTFKLTPDIQAYGINRTEDDAHGYHERSRSSVERYVIAAPPAAARGKKRYPKRHENTEEHYDPNIEYWEYPTMDYPYSEQNSKGKARRQSPGGSYTEISPGYTRTIVDSNKNIHGVSYHPHGDRSRFVRAQEIYPKQSSRR